MRDGLTIFAILLVAVLTAALVAPYFIDWNSHRAWIEAKLSQAAGTRVAIAGAIDVKLLPQPVFRLGKVTVGGAEPDAPSFTADEVDVTLTVPSLLRGDIEVADATLRSPRLDLSGLGGETAAGGTAIGTPDRFQFQHVAVVDGSVALATPDHGRISIDGLDLDAQATSLVGPFTANGSFGPASDRRPFRLSTDAVDKGRMRLKLRLDGAANRPAVDLEGTVIPGSRGAPKPSFDGTFTATGALTLTHTPATVPWRLSGHVTSDMAKAEFGEVELHAGTDMRALGATGSGTFSLAAPRSARLKLHATQINLDTLAVAPENSKIAAPQGVDLLRRLGHGAKGSVVGTLPIGLDLDVGLDTVTAGPQTLFNVAGRLSLDGDKPIVVHAAASGPDNARLALDGTIESGAEPVFRGRLDLSTRDLPRLAQWMTPEFPQAPDWVKRTIPARALTFAGTVDLSAIGMAARDLTATLDRATATGTLSYTAAVGSEPGRIFADLQSDALDLDALPDVADSPVDWGGLDLDLTLQARAVTVVPTGIGPVDAGRLALRLKKSGAAVTLDELSADIGSARVSATGTMDAGTARIDTHVDAPQLDAVAAALAHLMPGQVTDLLRARAATLSPAHVDLRLEAARGSDGALLPDALTMNGTLNGSRVKAELKPDRAGDVDPATATVSASIDAQADDGVALMRQLGLAVSPAAGPAVGAARFGGTAHGSFAAGFDAKASIDLAGARLAFDGRAKPQLGNGRVSLDSADLAPLLRATGIARPQTGVAWPAQAQADLGWHDSSLSLHRLAGRLAGVGFTGDLNTDLASQPVSADEPQKPVLFGALAIDRLQASTLFGLGFGPTVPKPVNAEPGSAGPTSAKEPRPAGAEASWSDAPFGPAVLHLPRTEIAMKVATLGLRDTLDVRSASLTLKAERASLTLADLTGAMNDGRVGATLTLRRDGPNASLSGVVSFSGVALPGPAVTGTLGGSLDLVGVGPDPAALVASLAGTGSIRVSDGKIPGLDPAALSRAAALAERNTSDADANAVAASLGPEFARAPLPLGDTTGPAALVGGTVRIGPLHAEGGGWTADVDAAIDLKGLTLASKVVLKARQPLPDWKGQPPQVTVALTGPLAERPARSVDAASFVNALQARAIARDQERIDIMQQDIRERAYFNRRLKAIEADQRAARDRARAEAEILRQLRANPTPPPVTEPQVPAPLPPSRPATGARTQPLNIRPPAARFPAVPEGPSAAAPDPTTGGPY